MIDKEEEPSRIVSYQFFSLISIKFVLDTNDI